MKQDSKSAAAVVLKLKLVGRRLVGRLGQAELSIVRAGRGARLEMRPIESRSAGGPR